MVLKFIFAVITITGGSAFTNGFYGCLFNILHPVVVDWMATLFEDEDTYTFTENENEDSSNLVSQYYMKTLMATVIVPAFPLGGIVGGLLVFVFANFVGRRIALLICNGLGLVAILLTSLAKYAFSYELLLVGGIIMGVSAAISSAIAPMYLIEICPDCLRGTVGSFYYVMMACSILYGYVMTLPSVLGAVKRWPSVFAIAVFPSVIQVATIFCCPESPKYNFFNKDEEDEAEEAMVFLRDDDNVEEEMEELREEANVLHEIGPVNCKRLCTEESFRSPLVICLVLMIGQQVSGINVVLYYSSFLFTLIEGTDTDNTRSKSLTIGLGIVNLVGAITSMILVDRIGRKILLMISFAGMTIFTLCLTVVLSIGNRNEAEELPHLIITFMYFFVISYAFGAGPVIWFITAELTNHFARPTTTAIAITINWLVHFVAVISFSPFYFWEPYRFYIWIYFLICCLFNLGTLLFIVVTFRETMGLSSIDILELFYD